MPAFSVSTDAELRTTCLTCRCLTDGAPHGWRPMIPPDQCKASTVTAARETVWHMGAVGGVQVAVVVSLSRPCGPVLHGRRYGRSFLKPTHQVSVLRTNVFMTARAQTDLDGRRHASCTIASLKVVDVREPPSHLHALLPPLTRLKRRVSHVYRGRA